LGEIGQRRQEQEQGLPPIEVKQMSGLSLKVDQPNQPNNVWKLLTNCDLYIPGSIRKIRPSVTYGPGFTSPILNFINYWAQPNRPTGPINRILGINQNAQIVDLTTGAVYENLQPWVRTPITVIPYLAVFPMFFNPFDTVAWKPNTAVTSTQCVMKYGSFDGILYIYAPQANGTTGGVEPAWRSPGDPIPITDGSITWINQGKVESERFQENALIVMVPGAWMLYMLEYQYDPASVTEAPKWFLRFVGVDPPEVPIEVQPVTIAPNLDGYSPIAGRGFVYTLYDPHSFHESSPSPFAGPTVIDDITGGVQQARTLNGSLLKPLPTGTNNQPYQSYQSYYLAISTYVLQGAMATWGYTHIYVYATKDGGATFYRIPTLLDANGNRISNSDGSVPIQTLLDATFANGYTDEFPLPTSMFQQFSCRVYEGSGPINLAPDPQNLGPESWSQANAKDFIVVPGDGNPPPGNTGQWAAAEIVATGTAMTLSTFRSNKIAITPNTTYFFEAWADATDVTAGRVEWHVVFGDLSNRNNPLLSLVWAPGTSGFQSGTFQTDALHPNVRLIAYANGIVAPAGSIVIWSTPLLFLGSAMPTVPTNYPTPDDALLIPAPAALSQNPPPKNNLQMVLFGGAVFTVEFGTYRIWYSNIGDFLSWGANNFLPLDDDAGVPILELANVFDALIVGKQTSLSNIVQQQAPQGPPLFLQSKFDPNHGVQSVRSTIGFGASFLTLLNTGITGVALGARLTIQQQAANTVATGFQSENVIGDPIKPITDRILPITLRGNTLASPCPAIDSTRNFYLFALQTEFGILSPNVATLLSSMDHQGPSSWSTMVPSFKSQDPTRLQTVNYMREVLLPTTNKVAVMVAGSGEPGTNFMELLFEGTQDGSLIAAAETWPLPDLTQLPPDMRDVVKIFHELWVEGEDITNWTYQFSTDLGITYSTPIPLQVRNKIGVNGRQISFLFRHSVPAAVDPQISYMKITYSARRQASGRNGY